MLLTVNSPLFSVILADEMNDMRQNEKNLMIKNAEFFVFLHTNYY